MAFYGSTKFSHYEISSIFCCPTNLHTFRVFPMADLDRTSAILVCNGMQDLMRVSALVNDGAKIKHKYLKSVDLTLCKP